MSEEAERGRAFPVTEYISVEYPGTVCNVSKALDTLGGNDSINKVRSFWLIAHWHGSVWQLKTNF